MSNTTTQSELPEQGDSSAEHANATTATVQSGCSADDGGGWAAWGAWGKSLYNSVKEKSTVTLEMVKKDLNEFVEVIQGDTTQTMNETAAKLKEDVEVDESESVGKTVKLGLSKLLTTVSDMARVEPDDTSEEKIVMTDDQFSLDNYNRKQVKINSIQVDPATYCNEPEGTPAEFDAWLKSFNMELHRGEMSDMLVQKPQIRAVYTQLVPKVVSHTVFWQRYFYKINQIEEEEDKREALFARVSKESNKEETLGWDDDDDDDDISIEVLNVPSPSAPTSELKNHVTDLIESEKLERQTSSSTSSYWGDVVDDVNSIDSGNLTQKLNAVSLTDSADLRKDNVSDSSDQEALDLTSDTVESTTTPDVSNACVKNVIKESTDMNKSCDTITGTADDVDDWGDWDEPADQNQNDSQREEIKNSNKSEILDDKAVVEQPKEQNMNDIDQGTQEIDSIGSSSCNIELSANQSPQTDNETVDGPKHTSETPNEKDTTQSTDEGKLSPNQSKSIELCESSSLSSWMSIDDVIKVKKQKGETCVDATRRSSEGDSNETSDGKLSSGSSGVLVTKPDGDDFDEFDVDDVDVDVNEEELAKMVQDIKSGGGNLEDDDDWENWE